MCGCATACARLQLQLFGSLLARASSKVQLLVQKYISRPVLQLSRMAQAATPFNLGALCWKPLLVLYACACAVTCEIWSEHAGTCVPHRYGASLRKYANRTTDRIVAPIMPPAQPGARPGTGATRLYWYLCF